MGAGGFGRLLQLFGLEVEALSAGHPARTRRARQFLNKLGADVRISARRIAGQRLERERQECVAGKDGRPLIEGLVNGAYAAPHGVIVHGRQIIVYQGVAMDALHGRRGMDRGLRWHFEQCRAFQNQKRAQALAPCQGTMPHGRDQPWRCAPGALRVQHGSKPVLNELRRQRKALAEGHAYPTC